MRQLLAVLSVLFLVGCSPSQSTEGTGTATPPPDNFAKVGDQIDKADARVSAGVQVARNANAQGKSAVVEQELAVVASYLPAPDPHNLAYISERVKRNDPAEYKRSMEAGAKLLAVIDKGWEKAEQDAKANMVALNAANKQIADLKGEVERVKTEGIRNAFTVAAGACFLAALGLAIIGQYIRALGAFVVGSGIGALPYLFASPWFIPGVAIATGLALIGVTAWFIYFRIIRKPTQTDDQAPPADSGT